MRLITKSFLLLLLCVLCFSASLIAQLSDKISTSFSSIKGVPKIIHYTKNDYNSDSQFWSMCEDDQGILYFGNNVGILIFDGERWQFVRLPNGSIVRSLMYSSDGKIYAGGYGEVGTINKKKNGEYYYESLIHLIRPEDRNFADVWQIHENQGYIVFRSFKLLVAIKNEKAITLPANSQFSYANVIRDVYYFIDDNRLKRVDFQSLEVEDVLENKQFGSEEVASILSGKDKELILFTKSGFSYIIHPEQKTYRLNRKHLNDNSKDQIFCGIKSQDGLYCLGTINNQIITYDLSSNKSTGQHQIQQLQDNTVLNLFESSEGNIWALLNQGVDCIEISSPISIVFDNAAIFDAAVNNNQLYLATNQGVYVSKLNNQQQYTSRTNFQLMNGMEAQAWTLQQYRDKILVGHDKGVFVIDGTRSYLVDGTFGVWKVIPVRENPDLFLACTYTGLLLLKFENGKFVFKNKIEALDISTRDILQADEPGVFWVCHGYKGVYKIKIDHDYTRTISIEHYTEQHGLPTHFGINVFEWNNNIVFTTQRGIYHFDAEKDRFELFQPLTKALHENHVYRKILQQNNRTWFIQDDELGYVDLDKNHFQLKKDLFLSLKGNFIKTMELIVPVNKQKVLIGTNTALYQIDLSSDSISSENNDILLTSISFKNPNDSLKTEYLPLGGNDEITLPYSTPDLRFEFASPSFRAQTDIQYSYILEDIDGKWSTWQKTPYKEYSYLQSGEYTFNVRSRSLMGEKSNMATFHFEILPVWYKTQLAILIFILLGTVVLISAIFLVRRKIRKTREEEQKLRKVLELELKQIKLEREKAIIIEDKKELEKNVLNKSKELANYTMLLVKKRELLIEMLEELRSLKDLVRSEKNRQKIRELSKKINFNLKDEQHLKIFEVNFEMVHQDFFQNLKTNYPELSQKDLQLCAFVKMNLSNKEISSILNISVRGVETARYRLRKRLNLSHEDNMTEFFENLNSDIKQDSSQEG